MDQLDRLTIKQLLDLSAAVQNEIAMRLIRLDEENTQLKRDSLTVMDRHDVSVTTDLQVKPVKNPSWINTGKLRATANRFLFRNVESTPQIYKRVAHKDIIWDVRWCPREEVQDLFASCSADRTARIWRIDTDAHAMNVLCTYSGHEGSVNTVRFHPTQNILCSSSGDRTCHIWKPSGSYQLKEGEEEEEAPVYRSSTPESQTVSKPLIKLISHQGFVTVGEWTVDGTQVLTGSQDATIKVWDMSDPSKPLFTFPGHDSTITSIACHPSNTNLFCSSSQDKTIRMWDTRTSSFMINVLHGHEKGVSHVMFDRHNPGILISGSDDCTVKLWDMKTLQCLVTIHTSYVMNHFSQSPEEDMLCLPSRNASAE